MGWGRSIAASLPIVLATSVVSPAAAQQHERSNVSSQCDGQIATSRNEKLDGVEPFAGASYQATFVVNLDASNCVVLALYRLPAHMPGWTPQLTPREQRQLSAQHSSQNAAEPAFFARRVADNSQGQFVATWAAGTTCPALVQAISQIEHVAAPQFTGPGPYRESLGSVTDMPLFQFWAAGPVYPGTDDLYRQSIDIKSNGASSPLSDWFRTTEAALASCWSSTAPTP